MGKDFKKTLRTIVVIIGLGALIWFGLKWFGGVANDNVGGTDGGASRYEDMVEN